MMMVIPKSVIIPGFQVTQYPAMTDKDRCQSPVCKGVITFVHFEVIFVIRIGKMAQ